MLSLSSLEFGDIAYIHLLSSIEHHFLPENHCIIFYAFINTLYWSSQKLFGLNILFDIVSPSFKAFIDTTSISDIIKPCNLRLNIFKSLSFLYLFQEPLESISHFSFSHSLWSKHQSIIQISHQNGVFTPLIKSSSGEVPIDHVSNSLHFGSLLSSWLVWLPFTFFLMRLQGVLKLLILIHKILSKCHKLYNLFFISPFLPLEESFWNSTLVDLNDPQFHFSHNVFFVPNILLPDLNGSVLDISNSDTHWSEQVILVLWHIQLDHSVSLLFKFLPNRNLLV